MAKCEGKECPSNKLCNPETGRCILKRGTIGREILRRGLKKRIYCGDSTQLPKSAYRFGTRFECLQCGYGAALYAKTKQSGGKARKSGCLRVAHLPEGHVRANQFTASPGHSLSPKSAARKAPTLQYTILIWLLLCVLLFVVLYVTRPKLVTSKNSTSGKYEINWAQFAKIYTLLASGVTVIVLFVYFLTY